MDYLIFSHFQAQAWQKAKADRLSEIDSSTDLALTTAQALILDEGVRFSGKVLLTWETVQEIAQNENNCFYLEDGELHKVQYFSAFTNRHYSLYPTDKAPTMLISGIPMHRIKGTNPHADTLEKIKALKPRGGALLDTSTGLGYTAIEAAKFVSQVITIELEPVVLDVARHNPWSAELFRNPKIRQEIGHSFDLVEEMAGGSFRYILHDPPAFSLAGELYSTGYYQALYRILQPGGRLFHYIGNPDSKTGASTTRGVVRRLGKAGFKDVQRKPRAFGLVAVK